MKLFFVLGSNPGLSAAEISALLEVSSAVLEAPSASLLLAEAEGGLSSAGELMGRLGGTVKIGRVIDRSLSPESLAEVIQSSGVTRPEFGISDYGLGANVSRRQAGDALKSLIRLGMETKRMLKEAGLSSRFVRPQDGLTLNSAAVTKNRLLESGGEFVVIPGGVGSDVQAARFGRTEAVQPFEDFSQTDYGRPARDAKQGMLPPKLARMMLNLAGVRLESAVWDPFCGSGTVLTEALRLGLSRLIGSDLNPQAINDSRANIDWINRRNPIQPKPTDVTLAVADARQPLSSISNASLDAIVSEVYLGPPRNGRESRGELTRRLNEIGLLVEQSLSGWKRLLKPGANVVLALPAYAQEERGGKQPPLLTEIQLPTGYRWQPLLPETLSQSLKTNLTPTKGGLIYGRPGQMVWREIVRIKRDR